MIRRRIGLVRRLVLIGGLAYLFSGLSCVQTAVETAGQGLSFAAATGVLGPLGPSADASGEGMQFLVDLTQLARAAGH